MKTKRSRSAFCALILLGVPSSALAESGRDIRLNQVDFDQASEMTRGSKIITAPARGRLSEGMATKLDLLNSMLVPRPRGVESDLGQPAVITTRSSWPAQTLSSCELFRGAPRACDKARTLREFFRRYTGSHDFYSAQCEGACWERSQVKALIDVKFLRDDSLRIRELMTGNECRLEVSRPPQGSWRAIQIEKRTCVCIERACLESDSISFR